MAGRDRVPARGIADDRGHMFPGGADDGAVDPDRGIEVEGRDLSHDSRAIAMVRSRHIDTGIEPDLLS